MYPTSCSADHMSTKSQMDKVELKTIRDRIGLRLFARIYEGSNDSEIGILI